MALLFRLAAANHRLVGTNHRLVGANHRLMGANDRNGQIVCDQMGRLVHKQGANAAKTAAKGGDDASSAARYRVLAAGVRSVAFAFVIVAKNATMRLPSCCDCVAKCRGDIVTKWVGWKDNRRSVVKNLCRSDGIV